MSSSDQRPTGPPALLLLLIRLACPPEEVDGFIGDLTEEHARRRGTRGGRAWWLWKEVLRSVPPLARRRVERLRRTVAGEWGSMRGGGMGSVKADLTYAFRQMRSNPAFGLVALMTLAIGIGANSTI